MSEEWILDDFERLQEEEKIKNDERLENLEKCTGRIKDLINNAENLNEKNYENLVEEIKWIVEDI